MSSKSSRFLVATSFMVATLLPLAVIQLLPTAGFAKGAMKNSAGGGYRVVPTKLYVQPRCKFSFNCPISAKTLLVDNDEETSGDKSNSVSVRWKGGALGVRLMKMPIEKAIEQTSALTKDEKGRWCRMGRFDSKGLAQSVRYGNLKGLWGIAMCGVSDEHGFHGAGGSCLSGFVSNGNETAYFETDGLFPTETVVKQIMPSFKFAK